MFGRDRWREFWLRRAAKTTMAVQRFGETPDGKEVLSWLYRHVCQMEVSPFVDGDPHKSAFLMGRQSVWLELRAELSKDVERDVEVAIRMEREQERLIEQEAGVQ